jgi:hypothetical protein
MYGSSEADDPRGGYQERRVRGEMVCSERVCQFFLAKESLRIAVMFGLKDQFLLAGMTSPPVPAIS